MTANRLINAMAKSKESSSISVSNFEDFKPVYSHYTSSSYEGCTDLNEQLEAAHRNIVFLQQEHAATIEGLHAEIERLQNYIRDLQFQWDVLKVVLPNNDFFRCDLATLEQKVNKLIQDNSELKVKLSESNKALEILDQKQKLELWQYRQELAEKDKTIARLQNELENKCSAVAELKSKTLSKKRSNLLRLFSFNSESASSFLNNRSFSSLKCQNVDVDDSCSEPKAQSLPVSSSPCHSLHCDYSSYSSLSDKSNSEDDIFRGPFLKKQYTFPSPKYGFRQKWYRPNLVTAKLPPLPNRELVRQQIRVDQIANQPVIDSLAIDHVTASETVDERLN